MNYISLFSSAGIGCFGFKEEGFECIASSELVERRLNIQHINNKVKYEKGYIIGDITNNKTKNQLFNAINYFKKKESLEEVDVIVFTPPCQGMSVANHKKNDATIEKNSLVVTALEIVKDIKPKIFISENVRAFMNTKCIDYGCEKKIKDAFRDYLSNDYDYDYKVINFKNYGANSSRTRTLVIGIRKDLTNDIYLSSLFPHEENEKSLKDIIGHLPSLTKMGEICPSDIYHNFKNYREDMRDWIHDIKEGESAFDNKNPNKRPHRKIKGKIVPNVQKNGDKYTRQCWNESAPCIHTRNDIISSQNTVHPNDDRVFSIRELMLMMNIPDTFKWTELPENKLNKLNMAEKRTYLKQNEINIRQCIGEAVPTIIMQKIAKNIKDVLNESERTSSKETYKQAQLITSK
jgi:DNA (cytosine-5)-methyltransferase 1